MWHLQYYTYPKSHEWTPMCPGTVLTFSCDAFPLGVLQPRLLLPTPAGYGVRWLCQEAYAFSWHGDDGMMVGVGDF